MKRIKQIKYLLVVLILVNGIAIYAQAPLDGYLVEAANNNPGLKSRFSEYMATLEKIPQAGALPDPQIAFGYFIRPVETRLGPQIARISASQMFPWFGTLGAKEDAVTEMAKSKYEMFEEAKSRLFYDVRSTYYNLYFSQKAINITIGNIDILNTFRKLALIKVEAGLASSADVLRVEIEIADLENQLALLRDNYFVMQASFNNLINVEQQRLISLPDSLNNSGIDLSYEAIRDSIINGNHQVLQLEFMEALYEKQEVIAKKASKPNLMLGIDYMFVGNNTDIMTNPSGSGRDAIIFPIVGISIPLYRQKYTSMVKEAVLMQESTEYNKMDKINVLETTFEKSHRDYRDADRRISLYKNQSVRAKKVLNILQTEYETSGKNFEEVLRVERQLLKYQLELEKASADKYAAIAFMDYMMGK